MKLECNSWSPNWGMLLKAAEDFNINLSQSWMIGDGEIDIKAGVDAGCKTVLLVGKGTDSKKGCDFGQDATFESLHDFCDAVLRELYE